MQNSGQKDQITSTLDGPSKVVEVKDIVARKEDKGLEQVLGAIRSWVFEEKNKNEHRHDFFAVYLYVDFFILSWATNPTMCIPRGLCFSVEMLSF